jgi:oxygen-independent coproporphyrinogen-3 oxidase
MARSTIDTSIMASYIDALIERIRLVHELTGPNIETIYIGGGTPTSIHAKDFARLLEALSSLAGSRLQEWTVEANPESLNEEVLGAMALYGATRLSLGVQSLDSEERAVLGRNASREDTYRALRLLSGSGFAASADLIAGVPYRVSAGLKPEIIRGKRMPLYEQASFLADLGIKHISIYDLVVEHGTAIAKRIMDRSLAMPEEDDSYEARKKAETSLKDMGYQRYEVSNFAIAGNESIHNSSYWAMRSYIGVGSGAVSNLNVLPGFDARFPGRSLRLMEGKDIGRYIDAPDDTAEASWISSTDAVREFVMMGLRTSIGMDESRFYDVFGFDSRKMLGRTCTQWFERLKSDGRHLRVDDTGMDILNRILLSAFDDIDMFFKTEGIQSE